MELKENDHLCSIGFLRALQDELNEVSQIIEFKEDNKWASQAYTLTPMVKSRNNWRNLFETALDDLTGLVSPKCIVYCEGRAEPTRTGGERGFDAAVFNSIFGEKYPDTVASQMWIKGETHWRRPDLIIFINGFPLVFIELKNSNIPVKNAYDINLKNYLKDIPYLFNYNQICVLSNGMETRLGSFAAGYEFFFEWLKVENEKENPDRKAIRENCTSLICLSWILMNSDLNSKS